MPHIKPEEKVQLEEKLRIQKMGELCYAFAEGVKAEYAREPRWGSIHNIARALFINPYHEEWSHIIIQKYASIVSQSDVKTAAFLCLLEFYRVVGGRYEDGMIEQNGNVFAGLPIPSLGADVFVPLGQGATAVAPPATPEALEPIEDDGVVHIDSVNFNPVKRGRGRPKKEVA